VTVTDRFGINASTATPGGDVQASSAHVEDARDGIPGFGEANKSSTEYIAVPAGPRWWDLVPLWDPDQVASPLRQDAPPEPR
jgi:hypothetical protein